MYGRHIEVQVCYNKSVQEQAQADERASQIERKLSVQFHTIDQQLLQQWEHANAEKERLIAELRAGVVRLRQHLATATASMPTPATSAGKCDAAKSGRLSAEDVAFLVELAAAADRNTAQLMACQKMISGVE